MEKEMSFVMIKPDGIRKRLTTEIVKRLYQNGLKLVKLERMILTDEQIEKHYAHLLDKPFFPILKAYIKSGEVAAMIVEGEDAINKIRLLVGPTDSKKASPGTIRGDYGTDVTKNVIHASDSIESARTEIMNFFNIDIKENSLTKTLKR